MLTLQQITDAVKAAANNTPILSGYYVSIADLVHPRIFHPYTAHLSPEEKIELVSLPERKVKREASTMNTEDWTDMAISLVAIRQANQAAKDWLIARDRYVEDPTALLEAAQ